MRLGLQLAVCLVAALCAALGLAAAVYPPVVPETRLRFPQDFGAHPKFRIEWWYLTGWLESGKERAPLGFQLTFFRLRPGLHENSPSSFAPRQLLFAHAALSDPAHGRLRHAEKIARAGFGLAVAEQGDTQVLIDDWSLRRDKETYVAQVRGPDFAYELLATPSGPPLLHGEAGFSRKAADPRHASHYYSRPQLRTRGWVEIAGTRRDVTGVAWLDHEWSSQLIPDGAVGWDWLGANLDDGSALMAFRLRDRAGLTTWASGTLQAPGKPARKLAPNEVDFTPLRRWRSPRTAAEYPVELALRAGELQLRLVPLIDDQELDARGSVGTIYWEGAVRVLNERQQEVGRGYLELTGYAAPMRTW